MLLWSRCLSHNLLLVLTHTSSQVNKETEKDLFLPLTGAFVQFSLSFCASGSLLTCCKSMGRNDSPVHHHWVHLTASREVCCSPAVDIITGTSGQIFLCCLMLKSLSLLMTSSTCFSFCWICTEDGWKNAKMRSFFCLEELESCTNEEKMFKVWWNLVADDKGVFWF